MKQMSNRVWLPRLLERDGKAVWPDLYTDGSVALRNPSKLGGAWCWCMVADGAVVNYGLDTITPAEAGLKTISNNLTELLAAVEGIEAATALLPGWAGTWWTDSKVTLARLTGGKRFAGVPGWLRRRTLDLARRRPWRAMLLGGHPSKSALESGVDRWGSRVSKWNVWADEKCREAARKLQTNQLT